MKRTLFTILMAGASLLAFATPSHAAVQSAAPKGMTAVTSETIHFRIHDRWTFDSTRHWHPNASGKICVAVTNQSSSVKLKTTAIEEGFIGGDHSKADKGIVWVDYGGFKLGCISGLNPSKAHHFNFEQFINPNWHGQWGQWVDVNITVYR